MEKLLQAAQAQLEKVSSKTQQAQKAKPVAKHQTPVHSAARFLPKDYPVRSHFITPAIWFSPRQHIVAHASGWQKMLVCHKFKGEKTNANKLNQHGGKQQFFFHQKSSPNITSQCGQSQNM